MASGDKLRIKQENKRYKAMAFAGCSFTWGQGLWNYANLDSVVEDSPHGYSPWFYNTVHHEFRKKFRWATMVADHFDTVAITHYKNGGANDQIVDYWNNCFEHDRPQRVRNSDVRGPNGDVDPFGTIETRPLKFSDISHFVYQFTYWHRSAIELFVDEQYQMVNIGATWDIDKRPWFNEAYQKWVRIKHPEFGDSPDAKFHESIIRRDIAQVKDLLMKLENNGIKTAIWSWPRNHVPYIMEDPWLKERYIKFEYKDKTYNYLEALLDEHRLTIEHDYDYFEVPPPDGHPGLACQKIIAEHVIDFIERQNNEK